MPGLRRSGPSSSWRNVAARVRNLIRPRRRAIVGRRGLGYQVGRSLFRRTPQVELKAFDTPQFTNAFRTPSAATSLSPVINVLINGPELYQRIGRKIYMKSLQIKGFILNAATSVQDTIRLMLVYDSQSNGAAPVIADILANMNGTPATTGMSMVNLNNRQRFQILRDQHWTVPAVTNTAGVLTNGPQFNDTMGRFEINWFVKLKGLETVYNNLNGGTIADLASGALYMAFVSNDVDATWNFRGVSRLRYYD